MKVFVDLTHKINDKISVFPGDNPPSIICLSNVKEHGHKISKLNFQSHISTHIDAPSHILEDGKNLDQFNVSDFFGKAYVIDCTEVEQIGRDFLTKFHDKIKFAEYLLLYTGKHKKWGTPLFTKNLTLLTEDSAKWLSMLPIKGIGTDSISFDDIDSDPLKDELIIHKILLGKEKLLIENLNNLDKIISKLVDFTCLPLYYENADGSPVRAVAYYDK